jgi:serine/threonine protein kinase
MAPELLLSSKDATPAADVYAIGACLLSMLTARPPFFAKSEVELVLMAAHDPPPRVRAVRPDVPQALDGVLQTALAKRPGDRHPSAHALADALDF